MRPHASGEPLLDRDRSPVIGHCNLAEPGPWSRRKSSRAQRRTFHVKRSQDRCLLRLLSHTGTSRFAHTWRARDASAASQSPFHVKRVASPIPARGATRSSRFDAHPTDAGSRRRHRRRMKTSVGDKAQEPRHALAARLGNRNLGRRPTVPEQRHAAVSKPLFR